MTPNESPIENRLRKNLEKLKPWADKLSIEAFRLYDRDIPEYPSIIEVYGQHIVLWDRRDDEIDRGKEGNFKDTITALTNLGFTKEKIVIKRRTPQKPRAERASDTIEPRGQQYGRQDRRGEELTIREGNFKFLVNLHDYLDTGLFLDQRLTRKIVFDAITDRTKRRERTRLLNLFCYTGSFSVYAAKAGAVVTSVDMSPTYLGWAERNFIANGLLTANHRFINDDVLAWLKAGLAKTTGPYEMIYCDPPTFSNSKKMEGTWEIQRDHLWLVQRCLESLAPGGKLIFTANRRDFVLDDELRSLETFPMREITKNTLPKDFHDLKIRKVFEFTKTP